MSQINHVFGKTLEFSTTVSGGKIVSQELVSSNEDSLISFKIDKNFLCPNVLRYLAEKIDEEKGPKQLTIASNEAASMYMAKAKTYGNIVTDLFSSSVSTAALAIAEYMANVDGLTLYESRVTTAPKHSVFVNQDGEPSEDPDDYNDDEEDEDDGWDSDDEEDADWDDEYYDEEDEDK